MKQLLFSFYILYIPYVSCKTFPFGFSYTRFSGPVSGPEKQIIVYDAHQHGYPHVDYIAKPDYQFSYGIDDPKTKVQQSRKEIRNGDLVQGEYSLVEPDGTLRIVKYIADDVNGFQAEVVTNNPLRTYEHHNVPEVIPVHEEVPAYVEPPPVQKLPPNLRKAPNNEQVATHEEKDSASTYSNEGSSEGEDHGKNRALNYEDQSQSVEFDDSSY